MEFSSDLMIKIAIWTIPVIFAITVHEAAHGYIASKCGDKTALMLGRVTLNPVKHVDLVGTILVPLLCLLLSNFIFGWAKPVPVNWHNLKNKRRDGALVSFAGPASNLLMAIFWAGIAKLSMIGVQLGFKPFLLFVLMGTAGIQINIILGLLNLIPIPPLDGSRILESIMPYKWAIHFDAIAPYGFMILLILMFTGMLTFIIGGPYYFLTSLLLDGFGLSKLTSL